MYFNTSNNKGSKGLVRAYFKSCSSTQSVLKDYCSKISPTQGLYVIADYQSEGKGQHGSFWQSASAKNVLMSMYLKPERLLVRQQFLINIWSALSVFELLSEMIDPNRIRIKWPNDVLVDNLKIAGLLPQLSIRNQKIKEVYLGVGVNLNQQSFQEDFYATSVKKITAKSVDRFNFAERLKEKISRYVQNHPELNYWEKYRQRYEERLWKMQKEVSFVEQGICKRAVIKGINEAGALNMETDEGLRCISIREVEFLRKGEKHE